jgi:DNA-binding NtrC family response regulator
MATILIVDDDENICSAFVQFLVEQGHTPLVASNGKDALEIVARSRPDLVIMDVRMPGMDGLHALSGIREIDPDVYVVIMTAYGTSRTSIEAFRLGAFDYLTKPLDLDVVQAVIERAFETQALSRASRLKSTAEPEDYALVNLVGQSAPMQEAYKRIGLLTTNDVPALIVGERGVGKQLVAKTIHFNSRRRAKPFVTINCRTLDGGSLELELFGQALPPGPDGAGLVVGGKLDAAREGTIFLQGVETLTPALQERLLRLLVDHTFDRPGATASVVADARVLTATDVDLAEEVRRGNFDAELYDTLRVVAIELPPLRKRREDVPDLVGYFVRRYGAELHKSVTGVDERVLRRLQDHAWPGNVGELENTIKRACVLARGAVITADVLGDSFEAVAVPRRAEAESTLEDAVRRMLRQRTGDAATSTISAFYEIIGLVEATLIREALAVTGGNQVRAAELLELNRTTLRQKMRLYDL